MKFFTTTNLRTQSSHLVHLLKKGTTVSLVHRSKIIGVIQSQPAAHHVVNDIHQLTELLTQVKPIKKITATQRQAKYSSHLTKKYG